MLHMKLLKCSAGGNKDRGTNGKELDEDEMLRRAIEEREVLKEEPCSIKGKKNFKYDLL